MDGTVWDSFPFYAEVLAQESNGSAEAIISELRQGTSIVTLCRRMGVTDSRFQKRCGACGDARVLYPGVQKTLEALNVRRVPMAVVTSLPARIAEPLLEVLDIRRYFSDVVNASNCKARKPSPAPLTFALGRIGVARDRDVYYVGDQAVDADAAKAAGVSFAWASYGYGGDMASVSGIVLKAFSEVLLI